PVRGHLDRHEHDVRRDRQRGQVHHAADVTDGLTSGEGAAGVTVTRADLEWAVDEDQSSTAGTAAGAETPGASATRTLPSCSLGASRPYAAVATNSLPA